MNKTIRNLAIAALFIFPGLSAFPQEVQQDETPAAKPVVEEKTETRRPKMVCRVFVPISPPPAKTQGRFLV